MVKKILFILLFLPALLQAQTNYYISTTGDNIDGDGSSGDPWATLSYACSQVTGNSIINVAAGSYAESSRCVLAPLVSIEGAGATTTTITFSYAAASFSDGCIYAVSSSVTDGNQHISGLTLTTTAYASARGIYTRYRNNFIIHDCTIRGFDKSGINAYSEIDWVTPPATYTTGFEVYNCLIYNNTEYPDNGGECNLRFSGHSGYYIHDNTIDNSVRVAGRSIYSSQVKNGRFRGNTVITRESISGTWLFAMELWNNRGGVQIDNNTFEGGGTIDIGGHTTQKGIYDYGVLIEDNTLILSSLVPYNATPTAAITIECWVSIESVIVRRNHIKNFPWGINITAGQAGVTIEDLDIYSNIIENSASSNTSWASFAIGLIQQSAGLTRRNINIINNTITGNQTYSYRGVYISVDGTNDDIEVKNNIIQDFDLGVRLDNNSGTIDSLHLVNNLINDCGTTVSIAAGVTSTNYANTGQLTDDPLFVSSADFHLQDASPAVGTGVHIGTPYLLDYDGDAFLNPPSRGAYEITLPAVLPTVTTTSITSITNTTASSGGNVTTDGGAEVTARGVCWATSSSPTTADSKTTDGTGTGVFVSAITGLSNGTTYYVRAYATNSVGTAYGTNRNFTAGGAASIGGLLKYNGRLIKLGTKLIRR